MSQEHNHIPVASGVLFDSEGRILLLKRSALNKHFQGFWQLPEGKIEAGEQAEDALARELKEELDIEIRSLKLSNVVITQGTTKFAQLAIIRIVYIVQAKNLNTLALSKDHDELQWTMEMDLEFYPGTETVLEHLGASNDDPALYRTERRG